MPLPGYNYVAIREINTPVTGARAYNEGDLVHEGAVSGPDAWLTVGIDVQPREGVQLDVPAKNAAQAVWAAFAISRGADPDDANGMSRRDLIAEYAPDDA